MAWFGNFILLSGNPQIRQPKYNEHHVVYGLFWDLSGTCELCKSVATEVVNIYLLSEALLGENT
jgi:hypothetical protein